MSIITITDDNVKERTVLVDDNDATVSIHVWYRCGGNKESMIILSRDELERIAEAVLKPKPAPASGPVTHGVDCPKAEYEPGQGWRLLTDLNGSVRRDGELYCNRCHELLPAVEQAAGKRGGGGK